MYEQHHQLHFTAHCSCIIRTGYGTWNGDIQGAELHGQSSNRTTTCHQPRIKI